MCSSEASSEDSSGDRRCLLTSRFSPTPTFAPLVKREGPAVGVCSLGTQSQPMAEKGAVDEAAERNLCTQCYGLLSDSMLLVLFLFRL